MTASTKDTIKAFFQTNDKPTEAQFVDLIDSYVDKKSSIGNLESKASAGNVGFPMIVSNVSASVLTTAQAVAALGASTLTTAQAVAIPTVSAAGDNIFSGINTFSSDVTMDGKVSFGASSELTIATGAVTVTETEHTIDTESDAASDDLTTVNGMSEGQIVIFAMANAARVPTIKNGTGNITTADGNDFVFSSVNDRIAFKKSSGNLIELFRNIVSEAFSNNMLHIQDQKTSGTNGGTFTTGAWRTRTLNTAVTNEITGASLASNQITLPAGTYYIEARAPAVDVNLHKLRLYDTTGTAVLLEGTSEYTDQTGGGFATTQAFVRGRFTLSTSSALELQHQCSVTSTGTDGLGKASSFGTEIYADIVIWKVG